MRRSSPEWRQVHFPDDVADDEIVIPGRHKPDPDAEWRLQCACVKLCRIKAREDADFRFICALPEAPRGAIRAEMAKRMGLQAGIADIILWRRPLKFHWVELKRTDRPAPANSPQLMKMLSDAQEGWWNWLPPDVPRTVLNRLGDFADLLAAF